ncbi:hypothetical protein [Psychromonas aquatilis]|uniref:Uncharacterized protein n=1 Tax=Psychromonas aquatilis TaxID=2005072 RepID=A0ABU9GT19_9GAMM
MKLSSARKIWITLFSIVCMLTSSITFGLPMMAMDMSPTSALSITSTTHQAAQCNMQSMDYKLHSQMIKQDNMGKVKDCNNSSNSLQDCCSDTCAAAQCMTTFVSITLTDNNLFNVKSNALLFSAMINPILNSPSSSLYRPPIS